MTPAVILEELAPGCSQFQDPSIRMESTGLHRVPAQCLGTVRHIKMMFTIVNMAKRLNTDSIVT